LYNAGKSRAIGDWVLGFNATRLYTLRYGNGKQVLSIGRVQTPTLAMIVSRQKEIENFKPTPFWVLQTKYKNTLFNAEAGKFENIEKAKELMAQAGVEAGTPISLMMVSSWPPMMSMAPIIQANLNSIGFDAKIETMEVPRYWDEVWGTSDFDLTVMYCIHYFYDS
jgi:DNA topoisomerase IA